MKADWRLIAMLAVGAAALLWAVPFAWMAVASVATRGPAGHRLADPSRTFLSPELCRRLGSGSFPLWYFNTVTVCGCILAVQLVTATAAGYASARLEFPGRDWIFAGSYCNFCCRPRC